MQRTQAWFKKALILSLMLSVAFLTLSPLKSRLSTLLPAKQTLMTQSTTHCPHQIPLQVQCQDQSSSFINIYATDYLRRQSILAAILLFFLILAAFQQPFIEPIDKPPKFSY